jgi:peptidylprolyl isomerase
MRLFVPTALFAVLLSLVACDSDEGQREDGSVPVHTAAQALERGKPAIDPPEGEPPPRLVVEDLIRGNGPVAEKGDELGVRFTSIRYVSGEHFETIWRRKDPFSFELGAGMVSPGWERGLLGMRVGGRRMLTVPPRMTSAFGLPPDPGPEDALIYVIDLLRVR